MMDAIEVRIESKFPIFVRADADAFGAMFAAMTDEDQVNVLRAMAEHMKPHQTQWDYISIALERPENRDLLDTLRGVLFPAVAS